MCAIAGARGNGMCDFTSLDGLEASQTLARQLVSAADCARDLYTQLGTRLYEVRLVRVRWAGGRRGFGTEEVTDVFPLLPTPKVLNLETLNAITTPAGLEEAGRIAITEISGRFTEDFLRGKNSDGTPLQPHESSFYEVQFQRDDGREAIRRRFTLAAAPSYAPTKVCWTVGLVRAAPGDRGRKGEVMS
jgi:hypothetical protein